MSKVDEIMVAVYAYGCARADERDTPTAENAQTVVAARASLRDLISASLAEARLEGAAQMREFVATWYSASGHWVYSGHMPAAIRALPLPP